MESISGKASKQNTSYMNQNQLSRLDRCLQRSTLFKNFNESLFMLILSPLNPKVTTSELSRFLDIVKPAIREFYTEDSHIDFSKLFRTIRLPNLLKFVFTNTKKVIQDVDIRSFVEGCPNLVYLDLSNVPSLDNRLISKTVEKLPKLETFILLKNVNINYEIFLVLSLNCPNLKHLEIGGMSNEFNNNIQDRNIMCEFKQQIEYNNSVILPMKAQRAQPNQNLSLGKQNLNIVVKQVICVFRHLFNILAVIQKNSQLSETISKNDDCLKSFQYAPNLRKLEIVYSRKFDENIALYLSKYFTNLRVLNLSGCPIQVSLEPLNYGCPHLEELNLSGDSWVKKVCLVGVAKHRNLQIFHLGHFEHSDFIKLKIIFKPFQMTIKQLILIINIYYDFKCQSVACEFPPKGFYIAGLFEKPENFPNIKVLFLEENCDLSDFLVEKISKIRPKMLIRFNRNESLIGESLDINEDDDE